MPQQVEIFSLPISKISFDEMCAAIEERIRTRKPGYVVTPNVNIVCTYHRNDSFRTAYRNAFLWLPDGTPLMWAAALARKPLKEKLSGSDMVPLVAAFAAERGFSVFLFGAMEDSARKAAERLQAQNPGLKIAGVYSPPFGFEKDPVEDAKAVALVRDAKPDICFVALGCPKQEFWMEAHCETLGVPVCMGIGGSLDFISGKTKRAPEWVQSCGLEWLWRLMQEPRRLWRRYLLEDTLFFFILARELLGLAHPAMQGAKATSAPDKS
jgi:N-acetylglucosaminyldiphosphoundecaprenol N-acetyl-beta-D-mannosaminyltransferase